MTETDPSPAAAAPTSQQGAYPRWQITLSFVLGWVFVIAGLGGLFATPFLIWRTRDFVAHAVHANAPIVEFKAYPPGKNQSHETYRPIVEVSDAGGASARVLVGGADFPSPYRIGGQIEVLYPPGKPADAVMNTTEDTWGSVIAVLILSPFLLLIGLGAIAWMRFFVKHPPEHLYWIDRWFAPIKIVLQLLR